MIWLVFSSNSFTTTLPGKWSERERDLRIAQFGAVKKIFDSHFVTEICDTCCRLLGQKNSFHVFPCLLKISLHLVNNSYHIGRPQRTTPDIEVQWLLEQIRRVGHRPLRQFGVRLTWGSDRRVGLGQRFLLLWCPLALNCSTERCTRGDISVEVRIFTDNLEISAFHRLLGKPSAVPPEPLIDPCRHQCPMCSFSTFKSFDRSLTAMLSKLDGSQRSRMWRISYTALLT